MENKIIYRILITFSIIVLAFFIIVSVPEIFKDGTLTFEKINNIFGNIIVITLFLTHNVIKNKDIKFNNIYKILYRVLIIITVMFCGIMFYTLFKDGFSAGKNLFWQINGIIFGIISFIFLQHSQQKAFSVKNNNVA